jgi:trk system potassium uptake protein TrkA
MKIIIFGMGNFGSALAVQLSEMGHEIIAIDYDMHKVEQIKEKVTHTICLDSTNLMAIKSLPLSDTDIAIVSIGENEGASIMTTANLKTMNVKRIISRSISSTQETVLEAMGVNEIVQPEQDSAERLAKKLNLKLAVESFDLDQDYSIVELNIPKNFVGKTLSELNLRKEYGVNIVTIIRKKEKKNLLGVQRVTYVSEGVVGPGTTLQEDDLLVVFGSNDNIMRFCNSDN